MTEQERYERGMVPSKPIAEIVRRAYAERGMTVFEAGNYTLGRLLHKWEEEQDWMDFDAADRALCEVDKAHCWWAELRDIYYAVSLHSPGRPASKRCERTGCSEVIVTKKQGYGKKYCGRACKHAAWRVRQKKREGTKSRYGTRWDTCPHGHDRSPENTRYRENGSPTCRACDRAKEARRYATNPDHAERKRQYMRDLRAKRKAAA